tara:strand:+ start:485 stop:727 length:243 start_codon:yes stop_codon:yes gene_type:complete
VRSRRDSRIASCGKHIARNSWLDHKGHRFDDKYKMLSNAFNKGGIEAVDELLEKAVKKSIEAKELREEGQKKIKCKLIKA